MILAPLSPSAKKTFRPCFAPEEAASPPEGAILYCFSSKVPLSQDLPSAEQYSLMKLVLAST